MNTYQIANGFYQNRGLDFHRQVLTLQKIPDDIPLYSSQVGYHAVPFEAFIFRQSRPIKLDDYAGKYLFIEFWGTWCKPCVDHVPFLTEAYQRIDTSKVAFLGIAQDNASRVLKFLEQNAMPWNQLLSTNENNLVKQFNVARFPTSLIVDPEGVVVAKDVRGSTLMDTLTYYSNL